MSGICQFEIRLGFWLNKRGETLPEGFINKYNNIIISSLHQVRFYDIIKQYFMTHQDKSQKCYLDLLIKGESNFWRSTLSGNYSITKCIITLFIIKL